MMAQVKVRIETYGCAMNQADSEFIAGLLQDRGFRIVSEDEDADIVVLNTCVVKTPTENKIMKRLRELDEKGVNVVVAGCLPAAYPETAEKFPRFGFIGTNASDVVEAVESAASGRRYVKIVHTSEEKVHLPKTRINPVIEITPIAEGCLGACSYCITRKARGRLKSYSPEKIVKQIREAVVKDNVKEVWITAQDTGAYGLDIGTSLPELLNRIAEIGGDFKVRVGMMNPNHVLDFLEELVESYMNGKIYKFVHLPVQSGDDNVLKDMEREYTVEDFRYIAGEFRSKLNATISTDVIVGYPTETREAFENTLRLMKETQPDIVNITRYWRRPGTKACSLREFPGKTTKERSRITSRRFEEIGLARNSVLVGWKGKALVSEKTSDESFCARNDGYKPIILKSSDDDLLGRFVEVEVEEATYYDLRGSLTGGSRL